MKQRHGVSLAAIALVLAACDTSDTSTINSMKSGSTTSTSGSAIVLTTVNPKFGAILVDSEGMTLYHQTEETGSGIVCIGSCTSVWPPLLSPTASPRGIDLVATVRRPDGGLQLTYQGMPLYRFTGDHQPGDTNGHGEGGVWVVAQVKTPSGATTDPSSATTAGTTVQTSIGPKTASSAAPTAGTTRPPTTTAAATTAPTGRSAPSPTNPTTAPASMEPPTTAPPTTSPPTTPAPTTAPPTTGGTCDYPPCS